MPQIPSQPYEKEYIHFQNLNERQRLDFLFMKFITVATQLLTLTTKLDKIRRDTWIGIILIVLSIVIPATLIITQGPR